MDYLMKETNIFYNVFCFLLTENDKFIDKSFSKLYCRTVFHTLAFLHHSYCSFYALGLDLDGCQDIEIRTLKKYRIGFLTGWNFMFQTTFLFISVCYDTLEWVDKHEGRIGKTIKYWRDIVFSALVVPITLFVTGMFWSVYSIDRELVFPTVYDQIVPWWFNHCVHTNIVIVVAIETILVARRKPVNVVLETSLVIGVTVLYAVVYYSIYFFAHRWLYGVFGIMTWWQVCLFQSFIWAISYVFYRIQYPINRIFHGQEDVASEADATDHGIKTLGKIHADDVPKTIEEKNGGTALENSLTLSVNGVEVNGNGVVETPNGFENGENGNHEHNDYGVHKEKGTENGVEDTRIDEIKRRNSNSPIFGNSSWSNKYRSLRNEFEKTKL